MRIEITRLRLPSQFRYFGYPRYGSPYGICCCAVRTEKMTDDKNNSCHSRHSSQRKTKRTEQRARLKQELPREGAGSLTDVQIVELLLEYAIPGRDVAQPARDLVARFGGVREILRASSSELVGVDEVDGRTTRLLRLVEEIAARCSVPIRPPTELLKHPREMERYLVSKMRGMKEENLLLLLLNDQGELLGEEILGGGTVNQLIVFPRQVMQKALQHNASALLIVHNHPHGPPLPTLRDREQAERLRDVLRPFDISVKDSIVVGAGRCFSIFANSPL